MQIKYLKIAIELTHMFVQSVLICIIVALHLHQIDTEFTYWSNHGSYMAKLIDSVTDKQIKLN